MPSRILDTGATAVNKGKTSFLFLWNFHFSLELFTFKEVFISSPSLL